MKATWGRLAVIVGLGSFVGCGGDGDDPRSTGGAAGTAGAAGAGATGGEGGAGGSSADPCEAGCVATLAADCENGPASQSVCVADCQMLMSGGCATEYRALQTCAEGEAITCNAQGLPTIEACATEQSAFVACLN